MPLLHTFTCSFAKRMFSWSYREIGGDLPASAAGSPRRAIDAEDTFILARSVGEILVRAPRLMQCCVAVSGRRKQAKA